MRPECTVHSATAAAAVVPCLCPISVAQIAQRLITEAPAPARWCAPVAPVRRDTHGPAAMDAAGRQASAALRCAATTTTTTARVSLSLCRAHRARHSFFRGRVELDYKWQTMIDRGRP